MSIEIDGLTVRQVTLLDRMWACDTIDQYNQFLDTLTESDRRQCEVLQLMVIFAELDEESHKYLDQASAIIDRFRL